MNILLAQNAFLIASDLYAEMPSEKTAYISTALFGIAAIISAENGQKDLAKTLLENAINMLALTEDKGYQAEMGALFSQTNQSQQLQVSEKKLAPYQPQQQKTMPVAAQNGENNLSGTYKMIENNYPQNTSAHDGRIVFTNSDIFLTQNGNAIKYTAHSKIEVAPSSYSGASSSGSITNSETMATGQLLGNIVEMNVHTITNYSGTTVTYSLGVSVPPTTTPPGQTIYDSKLRLTFLPDGKMKITNDKDRYYSIYQKQ